jgi:DNA modification methylase
VLDPFAGAGSTLLACKNTGRRGIGIEREGKYVEIIKERINNRICNNIYIEENM